MTQGKRISSSVQTGSPTSYADLWHLSWPLILTMFLVFSVGLTDVYVAGRFSPKAQGAIGFGSQVLFFFGVLANGLGVGLVAMVSRLEGAGNIHGMWHTIRQGLLLTCILTLPLSLAGIILVPGRQELVFLPQSVAVEAENLLPFYAASLWPQAILTMGAAIFRARAKMVLVLLCSGCTAVFNLIGDFVLAFGYGIVPAMGPQGVAMATMASSLIGALMAMAILGKQGLGMQDWQPDLSVMKRLFFLSWPAGGLQLGWQFGSLVLYGVLGSLSSGAVAATAAFTNGLRIEAVLYLPVFALNMITAVLVAQALGAGRSQQAEAVGWRVAKTAAVLLSILALPVFIYSMELARLITPDPVVQEMTHLYLRFNMISQPFMALSVCLGGALEGAGDTLGTMKVVLGALWGVRLPLAAGLALATPLAANGVWAAMVVSMVIQCIFLVRRFRQGGWKEVAVLGESGLSRE